MLTLRVVVADSVPGGEAEDSAGRALDSGTADLGGVLPDNLGEVTVQVNVHVGGGVLLAVESPVGHLTVVPLVGNTTSSSLVLESVNIAGSTPRSEVLAVAALALLPIECVSYRITGCMDENLHVVLENATVGGVLGVTGKLVVPLKSRGGVVGTVDVVVSKHDLVVGTLEIKVRRFDASLNSDLGFELGLSLGGSRLDNLLDGGLGLLNNGFRSLVDGRGGGGLDNNDLLLLDLLNLLGRLGVGPDGNDNRLGSLLGLDGSGLRGHLDNLGLLSLLSDLGGLGGLVDGSSGLGLGVLGDDDGDNLVDPLGLHGTLLESVSNGAGRSQDGASADHKQRCLHSDR